MRDANDSPDASGLSAERLALLTYLLEEEGIESPQTQTIAPRGDPGEPPLSFAQQRLWFLAQLEPESPAYNIPAAYRISGPLNVGALEQGLSEIIRRHETLRTSFYAVDGQPFQRMAAHHPRSLPVVDLRGLPDADKEARAVQLATEDAHRPFDLTQGPLFRATLVQLTEEEYVFFLNMHHIVSDGWSMAVLFQELTALYEAFSTGKSSPLPELSIQYADFSVWQRQWLQGDVLMTQLSYWKQRLNEAPPVLKLPTDYSPPPTQSFRGARKSVVLPATLSEALKALSRRGGVSLFMTLLAVLQILLHRHTGQDDIVIGFPIAGRNWPEIDGLIGFFVNTLVLRTDLAGNPSFRELLRRVQKAALEAYDHQDLPFERLVAELQLERDLNRNPLFDVMLNLSDRPWGALTLSGLTIRSLELPEPTARFALTVYATELQNDIRLQLVYQRDLFSAERMTCLLQQFRYLLEQIVAAPQNSIQSYSLVTPESRLLLPDPSEALDEPPQELVTNMFASWARRAPEQPAVAQLGQTWTYQALAERADALARALWAKGLKRGDVVAVYGQRSFGLVVSMLGVLLSGGVLLPIDRNLPVQRKHLMLREAAAKYLVFVEGGQDDDQWLGEYMKPRILRVDGTQGGVVDPATDADLEAVTLSEVTPDDAAYIFFTSGTSGVPKGVLGCHKGLSHFLKWQRETFAIGPDDRVAQLINLSFDPVLRDFFLPLTSGATLCLPKDSDSLGPEDLTRWLDRERISVLHTVPSLAEFWLANVPAGVALETMRWVFFSGECLMDSLVRRWRDAFPCGGEIVNLYGPTETTLVKCFYQIPIDVLPGIQAVGRSLPQAQALVLAGNGRQCGIGEPGEIVLRTPFRSMGYLNAPEEQGKQFLKNPFRDDEQDWLYHTGDCGCYRPDGTLEITGRLDDQIKIRGVRVEPDEVAATLAQHPAVQSCFVAARQNRKGQIRLVAYVVASNQDHLTIPQVKSYLHKWLPSAMVPTYCVLVERLPLLPNGKIDRRALPEPDQLHAASENAFVAPRTPIEEAVAGIWAQVLRVEQVGIHNNFFELGGHSLLATQVMSRLRDTFQVELPLRSLFEAPTVAELALAIAQRQAELVEGDEMARLLAKVEELSEGEIQQRLTNGLQPNS